MPEVKPIPEDLRQIHSDAERWPDDAIGSAPYYNAFLVRLIERIGAAEKRAADAEAQVDKMMIRMANVEMKSHLQTIDERDKAEESLSQAYYLIIGESPEWSNLFGHEEAIEAIDDAQRCLRGEIKTLEARVKALSRPVSDEEWQDYAQPFSGVFTSIQRDGVDRVLAARLSSAKEKP